MNFPKQVDGVHTPKNKLKRNTLSFFLFLISSSVLTTAHYYCNPYEDYETSFVAPVRSWSS